MSKAKQIIVTLDDSDEPIEFYPLHEVHISITRGYRDSKTVKGIEESTPNMFSIKEPNGVEVMLVVCAPNELKEEIVKAAMKIIDEKINS